MLVESSTDESGLRISYRIAAAAAEVYAAWTEAEQLSRWMGPENVRCETCSVDFRVGGKYEIVMLSPEGKHTAYGEYQEIDPGRKLVFTWQWREGEFRGSVVTLLFSEQEGETLLELEHSLLPAADVAEHHHEGWVGCFRKLETFLAAA